MKVLFVVLPSFQEENQSFGFIARCTMTVLLFASLLMFAPTTSQAQCPAGWIPGTTTVTVTVLCGGVPTVATLQIDYCYPGSGVFPKQQYQITRVKVLSPGPGSGCVIDGVVMQEIGRKLIEKNPVGFTCTGNCPTLLPQFNVSYAACMEELIPGSGDWTPCPQAASQGCADYWLVCCKCNGTLTAFYQGKATSDQCEYEWGCTTTCSPAGPIETPVCP